MLYTIGKLENRMPLSMRSNACMLDCSPGGLVDFDFGLLRPDEEAPVAKAVAAAADEDFDECETLRFCTPLGPEMEGFLEVGFAPLGKGFFLGGAIVSQNVLFYCDGVLIKLHPYESNDMKVYETVDVGHRFGTVRLKWQVSQALFFDLFFCLRDFRSR